MSSPTKKRLNELAERYDLPDGAMPALQQILQLVAEDDTAPTTVRDPSTAVNAHVADSLAGLEIDALRSAVRIADLGAGPGFPGLVLAAALPDARVALVESLSRKCTFLERAVERAGLANVDVVCARAEDWRDALGAIDVVTVRAVAPLNVLAEYAAPLLTLGGHLVAYKGVRDAGEEADGAAAAEQLGLELAEVRPVDPFPGADHRHLYVYSKVRDTPARFPRRAGMARKRPLSTKT
jgi:16S rRNA (guanine527-N7)-methyltransferase